MLPRILFSVLHVVAQRDKLKNPPGLGQFQLVVDRTQCVQQILVLFRFESTRRYRRSLHLIIASDITFLRTISRSLGFGHTRSRWFKGRGPWGYEREESSWIETNVFEGPVVELDSGVGKKTLANHPTKWDSGQGVPCAIQD